MSTGKPSGLNVNGMSFDDVPVRARRPIQEAGISAVPDVKSTSRTTVKIDPKRCRMWRFHDRAPEWYVYENCAELIESIRSSKQDLPAVGRYLPSDDKHGHRIELIVGGRRRYACEYLSTDLEVEIVEVSDAEAYRQMVSENKDRQDISFVERCMATNKIWKEGIFKTSAELANAEGSGESSISRAIRVGAFFERPDVLQVLPDLRTITARTAEAAAAIDGRGLGAQLIGLLTEITSGDGKTSEAALRVAIMRCKTAAANGAANKAKPAERKPKNIKIGLGRSLSISASIEPSGEVFVKFPKGAANASEADLMSAFKELAVVIKPTG